MIRIFFNTRVSTFFACNRADVPEHRFPLLLFGSRPAAGYGRVDFGRGATRRSGFANVVPRLRDPSFGGTGKVGEFSYNPRAASVETDAIVLEGDVVEYVHSSEDAEIEGNRGHKKLGVVLSIEEDASSVFCDIEPLRQDEPGSNEWVEDEDQPQVRVPLSQVQVVEAWPSQRMDTDRVSNPHGEHAHNVWLIDPASLALE